MRVIALLLALILPVVATAQGSKADAERALREIEAFTTTQARTDPHYGQVEAELLLRIDVILAASPPVEWMRTIRMNYFGISERLHREEREAVSVIERQAFERPPSDAVTWDYFERRLKTIGAMLEAGRIGPRGQALHALEAAKLYFPDDAPFLAYRQARVPIATAFEMGRITREEFDARWARAGEELTAVRRDQDRARAELEVRIATEELRMQQRQLEQRSGPSLGDRLRQQRGIRCTSTTVFGTTTTTCR